VQAVQAAPTESNYGKYECVRRKRYKAYHYLLVNSTTTATLWQTHYL
jgi:hypothetical protein